MLDAMNGWINGRMLAALTQVALDVAGRFNATFLGRASLWWTLACLRQGPSSAKTGPSQIDSTSEGKSLNCERGACVCLSGMMFLGGRKHLVSYNDKAHEAVEVAVVAFCNSNTCLCLFSQWQDSTSLVVVIDKNVALARETPFTKGG